MEPRSNFYLYSKQNILLLTLTDSTIMDLTDLITYDATVVTGLEKLAIKECREKVSVSEIHHSMGHVFVKTADRYEKLSKLHSVDNIYVVVYNRDNMSLVEADSKQLLEIFTQAIEECDWNLGIQVWLEASGFSKCDRSTILDRMVNDTNVKPSFRITCNRTGNQKFTSQDAAGVFGQMNDIFHWPVSLKQFDMEILLTIKEKKFEIAICLSKVSLYNRYIVAYGITSLRGTIAFNLIQLAEIQTGDIVCDNLCGSGVIPIETAISWPNSFFLAGDNNSVAIEKTTANILANKLNNCQILQWDATKMPLNDGSCDVFITDLPFGKRLGSKHLNQTLYPALMSEMMRCVRPNSGRVVLLTQDKTNANRCISSERIRKYARLVHSVFVKVGGLDASIYLLRRNGTKFQGL